MALFYTKHGLHNSHPEETALSSWLVRLDGVWLRTRCVVSSLFFLEIKKVFLETAFSGGQTHLLESRRPAEPQGEHHQRPERQADDHAGGVATSAADSAPAQGWLSRVLARSITWSGRGLSKQGSWGSGRGAAGGMSCSRRLYRNSWREGGFAQRLQLRCSQRARR